MFILQTANSSVGNLELTTISPGKGPGGRARMPPGWASDCGRRPKLRPRMLRTLAPPSKTGSNGTPHATQVVRLVIQYINASLRFTFERKTSEQFVSWSNEHGMIDVAIPPN